MTKKRMSDVEKALVGGVVGAALGAMFSDKKEDSVAAGLIGAGLTAWVQATKKAKSHNHPLIYAEHNKLVRVHSDGKREEIKSLEKKPQRTLPESFEIEW